MTQRSKIIPESAWIAWAGGFNPTPICAVVEVQHRDGGKGSNRAGLGGDWDSTDDRGWVHNGSAYDIVAYRVVQPLMKHPQGAK